jgi:hypothetical protein
MPPYASFLIRCWRFDSGTERIKVEHIQSGDNVQLSSLDDAIAWLAAILDAGDGYQRNDRTPENDRAGRQRWPSDEAKTAGGDT